MLFACDISRPNASPLQWDVGLNTKGETRLPAYFAWECNLRGVCSGAVVKCYDIARDIMQGLARVFYVMRECGRDDYRKRHSFHEIDGRLTGYTILIYVKFGSRSMRMIDSMQKKTVYDSPPMTR